MITKYSKTALAFIIAAFVVVLVFLLRYGKKMLSGLKIKADIENRGGGSGGSSGGNTTGGVSLDQVAEIIYDSFYNSDWFGWFEDETRAKDALITVEPSRVKALALVYATKYKKNLYDDFRKYLDAEQYQLIALWLR